MRIGPLRRRLELQAVTTTTDQGSQVEAWSTVSRPYCEVRELVGREKWLANQVNAEVAVRIKLRWRSGVTGAMRFRDGATVYNIAGVPSDPDGRRRELICYCIRPEQEAA